MPRNAELAKDIEALPDILRKGLADRNSVIITKLKKEISDTSKERFTALMNEVREITESMCPREKL